MFVVQKHTLSLTMPIVQRTPPRPGTMPPPMPRQWALKSRALRGGPLFDLTKEYEGPSTHNGGWLIEATQPDPYHVA